MIGGNLIFPAITNRRKSVLVTGRVVAVDSKCLSCSSL
jgi:hypothetical protein